MVFSGIHTPIRIRIRSPNNTRITEPVAAWIVGAIETATVRYVTAATAFPGADCYMIVSDGGDGVVGQERTDASVAGCQIDVLLLGARELC